jgi:phosphoglycolate phosphatase-like HAD superfamily hydrolase
MTKIKLVTWDIEGTIIPAEALKTPEADRVVRSNCLQLMKEKPTLPLHDGVEEVMKAIKNSGAYQGIASGYAYQFGNNYLAASPARDYIDSRLIILANKFAWEGAVLDKKDWDKVLKPYLKPAPTMLNLAKGELEEILRESVKPEECVHIGDQDHDELAAKAAGWKFYDIKNVRSVLNYLKNE